MKRIDAFMPFALVVAACTWSAPVAAQARTQARPAPPVAIYYPGPGDDWEHRSPDQVGMNAQLLADAIAFAKASESKSPRDLRLEHDLSYRNEPHNDPLGPFKTRGDQTGIVLRPADAPARALERQADHPRSVGEAGPHADTGAADLRIHELVPEHGSQGMARRPVEHFLSCRRGQQRRMPDTRV